MGQDFACSEEGRSGMNPLPSFVAASICFSSTTNTCTGRHHWGTRPFRWIRDGKATFQLIVRFLLGIRRVQFSCAVSAFGLSSLGHDRRAAALFIKTFVWRNGRRGKVYSHPNRSRPKWLLESWIAPLCTLLKMIIGPPGHHHLFWPQGCISALLCSPLGMNRSGTRCGRYWVVVYNG